MVDEFLALAYYRERGLPVVIFRLFNTVGPRQTGQYGMVIPRFVQQALRGEPLTVYGDGQQSRCFMSVHDAVRGLAALAASPEAVGQVLNLGSTESVTILDLARQVLRMVDGGREAGGPASGGIFAGEDKRIQFVPYEEAYAAGFEDMRRRVPNTARMRELTGWQAQVSLEETLQEVIDFYRGQA
jgi:UDP-glucose 4-epimerase